METNEDSEQKAPILHSADVEESDDISTEENDNPNVVATMDRRSGEVGADYSAPMVHKTALEPVPPPKVPESFDQEYEEKRKSAALASPEDGIVGSTDEQDEGDEEEEEEVWAQQDGHHYENPDKARQSMASSGSKQGYAYVEVEMQSPDPRDSTPEPPDSGADHDHSETEHLHTSDLPEQSVTHVCTPAKQGKVMTFHNNQSPQSYLTTQLSKQHP